MNSSRRCFHAIVCAFSSGSSARLRISGSTSASALEGTGETMQNGSSCSNRTVPGRGICRFMVNGRGDPSV